MAPFLITLRSTAVLLAGIIVGCIGLAGAEECASEPRNNGIARSLLQIGNRVSNEAKQSNNAKNVLDPQICDSVQKCFYNLLGDSSLLTDEKWMFINSNEAQKKCVLGKPKRGMAKMCDVWKGCLQESSSDAELEAFLRGSGIDGTSKSDDACVRAPVNLFSTPCRCVAEASNVCHNVVEREDIKGKKWNTLALCYRAGLCLSPEVCSDWKALKCDGKLVSKMKRALVDAQSSSALAQADANSTSLADALHARATAGSFPSNCAPPPAPPGGAMERVASSKHVI